MTLTDDAKHLLLELLAQQDAYFTPWREPHESWWCHLWVAVWDYRKSGLSWRSGQQTDAGRKQAQRNLESLEAVGFVVTMSPGSKRLQFIITEEGDRIGRALADCNDPDEGIQTIRMIHNLRNSPESSIDEPPWIAEVLLNSNRGWGDSHSQELATVSQKALPALVAGLLEANCDGHGRVYFRLSESGHAIASKPRRRIRKFDLPEPLPDAWEKYQKAFGQAVAELKSLDGRITEIGKIPLPVSMDLKCFENDNFEDDE